MIECGGLPRAPNVATKSAVGPAPKTLLQARPADETVRRLATAHLSFGAHRHAHVSSFGTDDPSSAVRHHLMNQLDPPPPCVGGLCIHTFRHALFGPSRENIPERRTRWGSNESFNVTGRDRRATAAGGGGSKRVHTTEHRIGGPARSDRLCLRSIQSRNLSVCGWLRNRSASAPAPKKARIPSNRALPLTKSDVFLYINTRQSIEPRPSKTSYAPRPHLIPTTTARRHQGEPQRAAAAAVGRVRDQRRLADEVSA